MTSLEQRLTHTVGFQGVVTLHATVPLENKALKERVDIRSGPESSEKAKKHRELEKL